MRPIKAFIFRRFESTEIWRFIWCGLIISSNKVDLRSQAFKFLSLKPVAFRLADDNQLFNDGQDWVSSELLVCAIKVFSFSDKEKTLFAYSDVGVGVYVYQ